VNEAKNKVTNGVNQIKNDISKTVDKAKDTLEKGVIDVVDTIVCILDDCPKKDKNALPIAANNKSKPGQKTQSVPTQSPDVKVPASAIKTSPIKVISPNIENLAGNDYGKKSNKKPTTAAPSNNPPAPSNNPPAPIKPSNPNEVNISLKIVFRLFSIN
jgi:hypothetical protein